MKSIAMNDIEADQELNPQAQKAIMGGAAQKFKTPKSDSVFLGVGDVMVKKMESIEDDE